MQKRARLQAAKRAARLRAKVRDGKAIGPDELEWLRQYDSSVKGGRPRKAVPAPPAAASAVVDEVPPLPELRSESSGSAGADAHVEVQEPQADGQGKGDAPPVTEIPPLPNLADAPSTGGAAPGDEVAIDPNEALEALVQAGAQFFKGMNPALTQSGWLPMPPELIDSMWVPCARIAGKKHVLPFLEKHAGDSESAAGFVAIAPATYVGAWWLLGKKRIAVPASPAASPSPAAAPASAAAPPAAPAGPEPAPSVAPSMF